MSAPAVPPLPCSRCGEPVPDGFDACWRCQSPVSEHLLERAEGLTPEEAFAADLAAARTALAVPVPAAQRPLRAYLAGGIAASVAHLFFALDLHESTSLGALQVLLTERFWRPFGVDVALVLLAVGALAGWRRWVARRQPVRIAA